MRACGQAFDRLRISKARKHDNSVWSIHTIYVNDGDDDDDDDQLSMSFVICLEEGQLVWNVLSRHPDFASNWIMIDEVCVQR